MGSQTKHALQSFAAVVLVFALTAAAAAQVPKLVSYQGYLTDAGEPASGEQSITFSIYASPTATEALWTETQDVKVADGLFNVLLGSVEPLPPGLFLTSPRYLGVRIGGAKTELSPRQQVVSVAFALAAYTSERLDGRSPSEFVRKVEGIDPSTGGNINLVEGDHIDIQTDPGNHSITISAIPDLLLPFTSTIESETTALTIRNTGNGWGIFGSSTSSTGIRGQSSASGGIGVAGIANGTTARGVYGQSAGSDGYGVEGFASNHHGVHGRTTHGIGVYGEHSDSNNLGYLASNQYGAYGENGRSGNFGTLGSDGSGAFGHATGDPGVVGQSTTNDGVWGISTDGYGVHGESYDEYGVYGEGDRAGVVGRGVVGPGVQGSSDYGVAMLSDGDLEVRGAYRGRISSTSASDGAPFPRPAFDSGWVSIAAGSTMTLRHGIGGDPDDYFVDLQFRNSTLGVHIRGLGADSRSATVNHGGYWRDLDAENIRFTRFGNDDVVQNFRIRIWVVR